MEALRKRYQFGTPRRVEVPEEVLAQKPRPIEASADLAEWKTDQDVNLLYKIENNKKIYLHAEMLVQYRHVRQRLTVPNMGVRDITTEDLIEKLKKFPSTHRRWKYQRRALLEAVLPAYLDCFCEVDSKSELASFFRIFIKRVVDEASGSSGRRTHTFKQNVQVYAAAQGLLRREFFGGRTDSFASDAGCLVRTDEVVHYGWRDIEATLKQTPLAVVQFKNLKVPNKTVGHRWYTVSGALLAETLHSMFGHDAPLGVAFTEQGFKIFFKEDNKNGETLLYWWPPGNSFHTPKHEAKCEEQDGLLVLVELARIATREYAPYVPPQRPALPTSPHTPVSGTSADPEQSDSERDGFSSDSTRPVSGRPAKKPRVGIREDDKEFRIRMVPGTGGVMTVHRLSLPNRFSPEELQKIGRDGRCRNWNNSSDDD